MPHTEQELIEKYLCTIKIKPFNTKKLFAIGLIGLTGSGKSFISDRLAEKMDMFVASNDRIRRFLNKLDYKGTSPMQETVQKIAEASSAYLYRNNISHIIDADIIKFHEVARQNAEKYGAIFFIIHVICPEETILERLKKRQKEIIDNPDSNLSRVGQEEYLKRKKIHQELPLPEIFFTIDTSKELSEQIDNLIGKLKKEKMI